MPVARKRQSEGCDRDFLCQRHMAPWDVSMKGAVYIQLGAGKLLSAAATGPVVVHLHPGVVTPSLLRKDGATTEQAKQQTRHACHTSGEVGWCGVAWCLDRCECVSVRV